MKTRCGLVLFCLVSLLNCPTLHARDSTSVVILSSRVGPVIDAAEAEQFSLFRQFKGFQRAKIFKTWNDEYYVRIWLTNPGGIIHDTVADYSVALLLILAEKVEHYEALKDGSYRMGDQPPSLSSIEESDSSGVWIPPKRPVHSPAVSVLNTGLRAQVDLDLLPFAGNTNRPRIDAYPNLGFGVGFSTYSADLSGLNQAVLAIENKYAQQGFSVGAQSPEKKLGPLIWVHLKIGFSDAIALMAEGGSTLSEDQVAFGAVTGSVLYHFRPLDVPWFRPYVGVGFGIYRFSVSLRYGARISPVSDYGSYTTLDQIELKGKKGAPIVRMGLELAAPSLASVELFAVYMFIPTLEMVTEEGVLASVKMGGVLFGARLTITF